MSSKIQHMVKAVPLEPRIVAITWYPDGTSAPTFQTDWADGVAEVTRTDVGTFLVRLADSYWRLWGYSATVQSSSAAALFAQVGDISNVASSSQITVVVRVVNGSGSPTEMTANANNSVCLTLLFNDSSGG